MNSRSLRLAIISSLLLHLLFAVSTLVLSDRVKPPQTQTVSVDFLKPEELEKMRAADRVRDDISKQIVEQDEKPANEAEPDQAKFLSAKNQTVKKQTIAVNRGDFQNTKTNSIAKPGTAAPAEKPTESKAKGSAKDLFANYDPSAAFERQEKEREIKEHGQNLPEGAQGSAAVSQSNDYVKNVDQGLETLLNTREFKYYSYYNRIRRQLAQHWEGKVREKLSKMYRERRAPANISDDKITKIIVVLNNVGTLVTVKIISDSGVRDLDDAAVEAFREAAPFPNPPKGIIEEDGTVKIRWDFVLES